MTRAYRSSPSIRVPCEFEPGRVPPGILGVEGRGAALIASAAEPRPLAFARGNN